MTKIICKQCGKDHFVEQREINRGGGIFCSNRCGTIYSNAHRKYLDLVCQNPNCNLSFKSKSKVAKYCSKQCCNKHRLQKFKDKMGKSYCTRTTLSIRVRKAIGEENLKCFICGWKEDACDIHHILPSSNGGTNEFSNLTVLCPNHHRLADRKILVNMPTVSDKVLTIKLVD